MPAGSTVDLVVNLGKETVSVIDVTGMRPERAQSLLEAEGLTLGEVTELYHESQPAGIIFAQEPRPGTRVDKGSAVAVMVSKGPEKETPPEQPAQPPTEPGVEAGGEEPQAVDPRVFVEENPGHRPSDPKAREFQVRVVAMGQALTSRLVRWRDETGATLREGPCAAAGRAAPPIRATGTVTIECIIGPTVFEPTRCYRGEPGSRRTHTGVI